MSPATPSPSNTILVVDDNVDLAELISESLRMLSLHVTTAHTPTEAIAFATLLQPKVCILDVGLPGMDGYQLGHELKQVCPNAVFVGHSAWVKNERRQEETQFNFDYFFTKPSSTLALGTLVQSFAK